MSQNYKYVDMVTNTAISHYSAHLEQTLKDLKIIAIGGLIKSQDSVKLYMLSYNDPYFGHDLPKTYIYDSQRNTRCIGTLSPDEVKPIGGFYIIHSLNNDCIMHTLAKYFNISEAKLVRLIHENSSPYLLNKARKQKMFTINKTVFTNGDIEPGYDAFLLDSVNNWGTLLPPMVTSDELADVIKSNCIAICGIVHYVGHINKKKVSGKSVFFFDGNSDLTDRGEDYSFLVSHVIDEDDKHLYTNKTGHIYNDGRFIEKNASHFPGLFKFVNVPLEVQIEACAKVMNVSTEEAYNRISNVTHKSVLHKKVHLTIPTYFNEKKTQHEERIDGSTITTTMEEALETIHRYDTNDKYSGGHIYHSTTEKPYPVIIEHIEQPKITIEWYSTLEDALNRCEEYISNTGGIFKRHAYPAADENDDDEKQELTTRFSYYEYRGECNNLMVYGLKDL
jgi:hypothetical protein